MIMTIEMIKTIVLEKELAIVTFSITIAIRNYHYHYRYHDRYFCDSVITKYRINTLNFMFCGFRLDGNFLIVQPKT